MKNPFIGAGVALVTPFNEDHTIDYHALRKLVRYQIDNGIDFLVVQGTTGESPVLSMDEKLEVLRVVQNENTGKVKIVFGIGGNDTVAIGETLKSLPGGIDGILSVSPYYNKPSQQGVVEHYKYLATCTELPIILYNVPGRTGSNVTASSTLELSKIENIIAMKEASGDFGQIMDIIQNMPEGFSVLSGDDAIVVPLMSIGVEGVISVSANAYPKLFSDMVHDAANGDFFAAKEKHYKLHQITQMLFEEGNPGGVKVALAKLGIMKPFMRRPLYPVSEELKIRIEAETEKIIAG
ncbi:4-hydroxy-tetrahydrodipicolinate synthase [Crocinitomicaceae bacterium]|nr:4-hydroxy-tetrahydrodipicolinate synthase [Crocinitomicaceae bacterium]MDB4324251.1 4-hydroxy-tetrahydrodipicolinate synthase [Crocinitomicaceae bacterium]